MRIWDYKNKLKLGKTPEEIADKYGIDKRKLRKLVYKENFINPSKENIKSFGLKHGQHYDITEEEIMRGYVPPKPEELKGYELIYYNKLK